jgi:hypothetical protein
MAQAKMTTDHDQIRKWVEARGGFPARVKGTGRGRGAGVLRVDYPGFRGQESLEKISWDDWFDTFDDSHLAFLYQEGRSRFSKLVDRDSVKMNGARGGGTRATNGRGAGAKRTSSPRARAGAGRAGAARRTKPKRATAAPRPAGARKTTAARATRAARTSRTTSKGGSMTRMARTKSRAKKAGSKRRSASA